MPGTSQSNGSKELASAVLVLGLILSACSRPANEPKSGEIQRPRPALDTNLYRVVAPGRAGAKPPMLALTKSDGIDDAGAIAPDGNWFAFQSDQSGHSEIWIARRDGSGARALTSVNGAYTVGNPSWSPDAQQIAYDGGGRVFMVPSAGGKAREIMSQPCSRPAWSRDRKSVYCDQENQIYCIEISSGKVEKVIDSARDPRISTDGKYLYFERPPGIWRISLPGGKPEQIVPCKDHCHWTLGRTGVYFADVSKLMKAEFDPPRSVEIFDLPERFAVAVAGRSIDISPDENWFLMRIIDRDERK